MTTLTTIKDAYHCVRNQLNYLNDLSDLSVKLNNKLNELGLENETILVSEIFDSNAIKYLNLADYGFAKTMIYTQLKRECNIAYILLHQVEGVKVGQ